MRSDSEVDEELKVGVARIDDDPKLQPLKDVIDQMGRLYETVDAAAEPSQASSVPDWLHAALRDQLNLGLEQIAQMTEQRGQELLMEYWSRNRNLGQPG